MDGRDASSRGAHAENSVSAAVHHATSTVPVETQKAPLSLRVDGLSAVAVAPGDGNSTPAYIESERGSDTSDGRRADLYSASTFADSLSSLPSSNDTSRFPDFGNSFPSNEHGSVPPIDHSSSQSAMAPHTQSVNGNVAEKWQPSLPTIKAGNGSPTSSPKHSRTKSNVDELAPGQKRTATGDIKPVSLDTPMAHSDPYGAARRRSKSTGSSVYGSRIAQLSVHIRTRLSYAAAKVEKEKEKARLSLEAGPHPTLRTYHSASPLSTAPSDIASAPEINPPSLSHQSSSSSNGNSSRFPGHSRSRSAFSSPHLLSIPKLAPPVDIISNGETRRRRPNPNAISKPNHSPVGRHRRHHSHQENVRNRPVLGPGTPSLSSTTNAPTSTPNGFYRPRTNSENTSMEQDAIETLMFMSSPENSGYRFSPRPLQAASTQSSLNESINTNRIIHNGSQGSQSSGSHSGRGHQSKPGLEAHAGDDIDRLLDQMDSDSEDEGRYASYRPAISGAHPFRGHHGRQRCTAWRPGCSGVEHLFPNHIFEKLRPSPMLSSKPYQCQRCSRAFARLEHLQRHDRSHTKEKPFTCTQCPKAFTRKDLLARHERLSHAEGTPSRGPTTPSPAHPILDGLDTLASVVTDHVQSRRSIGSNDQFSGLSPGVHRTPLMGAQLAGDTPSAGPTPIPGPDFGYLGGFAPGQYEGNDFTSFLDSVPLPSHPFSPAYQPLPLFPPLQFSHVPDYDQSSDRAPLTETTSSTPSSSVLPRHGAQLPSLQPEGYQTSTKARQPTGFVPVTAQCRDKLMNLLSGYANVVPDPSLPSRHALSRCLTGYLTGFHDHYPIVHIPTLDVESMTLPLFLSMAALGARYCREPETSMRLYQIAKPVTLEHVRRVFQCGKMPPVNVADDADTLETLQALLCLTSVSAWFINDPPYHEALSIRSLMEMLLRNGGLNRLPEHDGTWHSWIRRESVKRTRLIVFCFFNIHTIVFDVPPVILTEEVTIELPCTEQEWQAPHADLWHEERMKSPGEPRFQNALSALFEPDSNVERFSSLGGYVLIHAILQDIWLMTKAGRLPVSRRNRFDTSCITSTPELVSVEQALERWCQCWERNQESSIDPLSPHGPLSFTSAALLRLAYIRLNADCGSARQLQTWDPVQIATSLRENLSVRRGDRLTRAALHCAHALSTPVKLGIGFVAHSQVALWSNQHALCSLECAVLLAKWLEAVTVPHPEPALTEQEARLRDFVLEMVMEVQHGVSREWLLATNTRLSAAVTRLWARLFTADYIWEMVALIGRSLNSYADLLEQ